MNRNARENGAMTMFHILVVEDNANTRKLMEAVLTQHGYQPILARDGLEALEVLDRKHVDLIVLDIMMPRMDGYEFTRTLRESGCELPILMVTAKEQYSDMEEGFLSGTDDYMIKPINPGELLLRVRALLRRAQINNDRRIVVGSTTLDCDTLTVRCGSTEQILPQKEFFLLYKLLSYPGKIFTRQQLMDEIWGLESESDVRTVDVDIGRLRDKLGEVQDDFEIVTIRGLGYKAVKSHE
jgi:DNA-binding response OmpR family regulator